MVGEHNLCNSSMFHQGLFIGYGLDGGLDMYVQILLFMSFYFSAVVIHSS